MRLLPKLIRSNSFLARQEKYILVFLHGLLLPSLIYFAVERQYENALFASLSSAVKTTLAVDSLNINYLHNDSLLAKSVHLVHQLGVNRINSFGANPVHGAKADILHPVSIDLMTAQEACGSYAFVLGRLLDEMNIEVRFPQMTVEHQPAGHILVEAKMDEGWVVLDAASDVYFKKPAGRLAGFEDVKNNWAAYRTQLPADYNMAYSYEDVRYTNWDKIPVIMPFIKKIMYLTVGKERTDTFSFRSLILKKYNCLFNITAGIYLLVVLFSINALIKTRRKYSGVAVKTPVYSYSTEVSA